MTITLQAVNELIQSLESAGELSIKETKVMALAKAYQQLAAENVALKATSDDRRMFIMNGVQLGYIKVPTVETDPALETIRFAVSPQEPTPATDRIVAGIKADGVEEFAEMTEKVGDEEGFYDNGESSEILKYTAKQARLFAKQLREGADK
ncbi:hypothetical protein FP365_12390 [Klebsiella michiganensis]|uniref:hypothetical protein n=1 Tax=Klebsiella michiganensis TaxID=1134687 RepID=UPI001C8B30D1|nr:hypothetical protein [Klebsiella michiganensis]MBX8654042.1 hypothetical protein [Klebsiella michiganensis]